MIPLKIRPYFLSQGPSTQPRPKILVLVAACVQARYETPRQAAWFRWRRLGKALAASMMSPSRGKSHLSLLKPASYLRDSATGQVKETAWKLSSLKLPCPQIVEKPAS